MPRKPLDSKHSCLAANPSGFCPCLVRLAVNLFATQSKRWKPGGGGRFGALRTVPRFALSEK